MHDSIQYNKLIFNKINWKYLHIYVQTSIMGMPYFIFQSRICNTHMVKSLKSILGWSQM